MLSNLLMLTGSLYMMQVYDRVLSSRSVSTLLGVSIIALIAYGFQAVLDHLRLKILGRIGAALDEDLAPLTVQAALSPRLRMRGPVEALRPFRDLDAIRSFLSSMGPTALIDLPFAALFLVACFLLHPTLGFLALGSVCVIVSLSLFIDMRSQGAAQSVGNSAAEQMALLEAGRRNAELMNAMGMSAAFEQQFRDIRRKHVDDTLKLSNAAGGVGSFAKAFRYILQSAVIGVGAWLVIRGELSGGAMLAASILTSRALAPVELMVGHWKSFAIAREGYSRLRETLDEPAALRPGIALPRPARSLVLEDVSVATPGAQRAFLMGVSFRLQSGEALGLIGPSGSGKSTLVRAIIGSWTPRRGAISLDGASLSQWDPQALGKHVGYLPQDVELFPGTVAANIARMDRGMNSEKVLAASMGAGAHDMIVALPMGYDTPVGEGGAALSGGQRQRIALARALYGDPFLVVLDEPNSSLDADGDAALTAAIMAVKARNGIVIVVTHRPAGLAAVDKVGVLKDGRLRSFGAKDEVLPIVTRGEAHASERPAAAPAAADPVRLADQLRARAADMRAGQPAIASGAA
jgi:ATP-binding cassette subfamily C protein